MRGRTSLLVVAAALAAALATPATANGWGDGVELIADDEMAGLRGGIAVSPGLDVNFGAQVTTFVNGTPALVTNLTWTDMGAFIEETVGDIGQRVQALTPQQRSDLGLAGLDNASGVVVADESGVTTLVHNVTEGALQNIIMNTASGRDLRQEIDVTLTLPGFEAVQDSLVAERLGIRLDYELQSAAFR